MVKVYRNLIQKYSGLKFNTSMCITISTFFVGGLEIE